MTILEIMERTGARDPGLVRAYINDALQEIQRVIPNRTTYTKINVVSGQRFYTLPATMEELLGVYRRYDSQGRYTQIGRIAVITLEEPTTAVSVSTDLSTDIVVE